MPVMDARTWEQNYLLRGEGKGTGREGMEETKEGKE